MINHRDGMGGRLLTGDARPAIVRSMLSVHQTRLRLRVFPVLLAFVTLALSACASSLDMSSRRLPAPDPDWGIVIGSVLVRQTDVGSTPGAAADDRSAKYAFDVVQIQPTDPNGETFSAARYHIDTIAGQERPFVSRLRPGQYLMKNFHRTGMSGTGGDLNLVFESQPGRVAYVGRVLVEVPSEPAYGKEYRFFVQDAHEATYATLAPHHGQLTQQAVTAPMRIRPGDTR